MRTLSAGARGADVLFLQRLLNKKGANPRLAEDEIFGPKTRHAVVAFQGANTIAPANGIVEARTWSRLGASVEVEHAVTLFGQPTGMTCWSAAATMIVGNMSVGPGQAQTGPTGGLGGTLQNIETFLSGLRWRLVNNQSQPPASTLISAIAGGPLWLGFEGGTFQHAVVASALYSDRTDDGTVMRLHDPWPPGHGTVYGTTYVGRRVTLKSVSPPRVAMIEYVASPR